MGKYSLKEQERKMKLFLKLWCVPKFEFNTYHDDFIKNII